jgi:hypothetical protein
VVQDVLHLARCQAPVDGQRHGVRHAGAEEEREILARVLVEHGHALLRLHAIGEQGLGHLRRLVAQLAVGPAAVAATHGERAAAPRGVCAHDVGEGRDRQAGFLRYVAGP